MLFPAHYYTLIGSLPALPRSFEQLDRVPISPLKLKERLKMLEPDDACVIDEMSNFLVCEEGVTLDDFVRYQKSLFVDMVYLQQDGFDSVDAAVPLERQKQMFGLIQRVLDRDYHFRDKEQVRKVFVRLTGLFKNLNYARQDSSEYQNLMKQIEELRADASI